MPGHGLPGDRPQRAIAHDELHPIHLEDFLVLTDEGVAGLHQDRHQVGFGQRLDRHNDRETADELGDEPIAQEILGHDLPKQFAHPLLALRLDLRPKSDAGDPGARLDDPLETVKRPAADE